MDWHLIAAVLVTMAASYLLGCCNTSIVISKYVLRDDVRNHGSGNAGLTNFYRVFGKQKILLVILADVLKTVIAVLAGIALFRWAGSDPIIGKLLGGLFCMIGHMFPFQFEFKGGKGVLAGGTMACFMGWKVAVAVWGIFFLMVHPHPLRLRVPWALGCSIPSPWAGVPEPVVYPLGTGGWWAAGVAA